MVGPDLAGFPVRTRRGRIGNIAIPDRVHRMSFIPLKTPAPLLLRAHELVCERDSEPLFAPVDLELSAGGLLVLEGVNGSGKTTLLRALLGLNPLRAQWLEFAGLEVLRERHGLRVGTLMLGHLLGLKGDLSVRENLEFALALAGEPPAQDSDALFAELGLAGYEDTPTRALSAGQRKRAALARLAASARPLWLLDEPFANLDAPGIALVERLLARHRARGGGAIVSSHGLSTSAGASAVLRLERAR